MRRRTDGRTDGLYQLGFAPEAHSTLHILLYIGYISREQFPRNILVNLLQG